MKNTLFIKFSFIQKHICKKEKEKINSGHPALFFFYQLWLELQLQLQLWQHAVQIRHTMKLNIGQVAWRLNNSKLHGSHHCWMS